MAVPCDPRWDLSSMRFDCLTLFPEFFELARTGVNGRGFAEGTHEIHVHHLRSFSDKTYGQVDDSPFGGGPGMVLAPDVLQRAISNVPKVSSRRIIHFSPRGATLNHKKIQDLLQYDQLVLIASRYEGVDQRAIDALVDEEMSIGDLVVSGGELPALVLIDAVCRWLPGNLGNDQSAENDSFARGLLDHDHFTRPEVWNEFEVPHVLRSGHHEQIRLWRLRNSMIETQKRRPDLWDRFLRDHVHSLSHGDQWVAWQVMQNEEEILPPKSWKGWPQGS